MQRLAASSDLFWEASSGQRERARARTRAHPAIPTYQCGRAPSTHGSAPESLFIVPRPLTLWCVGWWDPPLPQRWGGKDSGDENSCSALHSRVLASLATAAAGAGGAALPPGAPCVRVANGKRSGRVFPISGGGLRVAYKPPAGNRLGGRPTRRLGAAIKGAGDAARPVVQRAWRARGVASPVLPENCHVSRHAAAARARRHAGRPLSPYARTDAAHDASDGRTRRQLHAQPRRAPRRRRAARTAKCARRCGRQETRKIVRRSRLMPRRISSDGINASCQRRHQLVIAADHLHASKHACVHAEGRLRGRPRQADREGAAWEARNPGARSRWRRGTLTDQRPRPFEAIAAALSPSITSTFLTPCRARGPRRAAPMQRRLATYCM